MMSGSNTPHGPDPNAAPPAQPASPAAQTNAPSAQPNAPTSAPNTQVAHNAAQTIASSTANNVQNLVGPQMAQSPSTPDPNRPIDHAAVDHAAEALAQREGQFDLKQRLKERKEYYRRQLGELLAGAPPGFHPKSLFESPGDAAKVGATLGVAGLGTAALANASYPSYLWGGMGSSVLPVLPALGAGVGYMIGNRLGNGPKGALIGGATSTGVALASQSMLGASFLPTAAFLPPLAGAAVGRMIGGHLGHPTMGTLGGAALGAYGTYALGGGALLAPSAPFLVSAAAAAGAGYGLYKSAVETKKVWKGEGKWGHWFPPIAALTGFGKGFSRAKYEKIKALEHPTALVGKSLRGLWEGISRGKPEGRMEKIAAFPAYCIRSPWDAIRGIARAFTGSAPEGIVQRIFSAPRRVITGAWKNFSGEKPKGITEKLFSWPGRLARWALEAPGAGGHAAPAH